MLTCALRAVCERLQVWPFEVPISAVEAAQVALASTISRDQRGSAPREDGFHLVDFLMLGLNNPIAQREDLGILQ